VSASRLVVDWGVAGRAAGALAHPPTDRAPTPVGYNGRSVAEICDEAIGLAADYTQLPLPTAPPAAELIGRREWASNALATMALAARPLEHRIAEEISLPGPLEGVARRVIGAGVGLEVGAAVGYASRRVLGQYDFALFGPPRPGRLLFVGQNLDQARAELAADADLFLRWVALHETTHVLQLESVPWLGEHVRGLAARLLDGAGRGIDTRRLGELVRRFLRSPRELARALMRGELVGSLADPEQRATLDRLQATMAVIEGHAEHVMDVCGARIDPRVGELRERMEARRSRGGGLGDAIARLLGMDLKLRQYRLGKRFWDAIVAEGEGGATLLLPWRSADDLPEVGELERPREWLDRVGAVAAAR
jgi:coenzyme F420 biosynthesis associated uncharacterized protein